VKKPDNISKKVAQIVVSKQLKSGSLVFVFLLVSPLEIIKEAMENVQISITKSTTP